MQKRLLILFILFGLATAYSLISLFQTNDSQYSYRHNDYTRLAPTAPAPKTPAKGHFANNQKSASPVLVPSSASHSSKNQKQIEKGGDNELPFLLKLVGISEASSLDEQNTQTDSDRIYVLIQFNSQLFEHRKDEYIGDSDIRLININKQSIDVSYNSVLYNVVLTPPNLLADKYKKDSQPYSELIEMTAQDIGTRPRILEHLITLTQTPYIADGQLVSPGLNPVLFEQAGFTSDDVLKTINGKSVTLEEDIAAIQKELKMANTLEFVVMRRGRLVTLFLDIPSESLELTVD